MIPVTDLRCYSDRANQALTTLRTALNKPTLDVACALGIVAGIIADIQVGRHPLKHPDDWPQRNRWPQRPHWDKWASVSETLAAACGARAQCDQKYEYLDISLSALRDDQVALLGIADLIELTSDHEDVGDAMCRYLTHAEIKSLRTEMRRDGLWAKIQLRRRDLLRAVPVHETLGSLPYIMVADIPEPFRGQFAEALRGSASPLVSGAGPCAYAHDWQQWVAGTWHDRPGPDFSIPT